MLVATVIVNTIMVVRYVLMMNKITFYGLKMHTGLFCRLYFEFL